MGVEVHSMLPDAPFDISLFRGPHLHAPFRSVQVRSAVPIHPNLFYQ